MLVTILGARAAREGIIAGPRSTKEAPPRVKARTTPRGNVVHLQMIRGLAHIWRGFNVPKNLGIQTFDFILYLHDVRVQFGRVDLCEALEPFLKRIRSGIYSMKVFRAFLRSVYIFLRQFEWIGSLRVMHQLSRRHLWYRDWLWWTTQDPPLHQPSCHCFEWPRLHEL